VLEFIKLLLFFQIEMFCHKAFLVLSGDVG
jgi:hypothetical protein